MQKNWRFYLMIAYVVVSLGYISYRLWQDFVERYATKAFAAGKADTIQAVINQASPDSCQSFTVYNEQQGVELINTVCLQPTATDAVDSTTNNNQ